MPVRKTVTRKRPTQKKWVPKGQAMTRKKGVKK
jgi:hypothetical protein